MASFMRVSYKLVFYLSKCISAIKRMHSTTATYISSSSFMYLCIPCYCVACLKSRALRVGVKTLHNTIQKIRNQKFSAILKKAKVNFLPEVILFF